MAHKKTHRPEITDEHPSPSGNQPPAECGGTRGQMPEREKIAGATETPSAEIAQDENEDNDNQPQGTIVSEQNILKSLRKNLFVSEASVHKIPQFEQES